MTTPQVDVGGSQVKSAMSATQSASVLLQAYTQTVLGTPDIKLPESVNTESNSTVVQDLPKHQALARTNATTYLTSVNKTLIDRVADIIGFSNLWNAEYTTLVGLAKDIDSGDNKATFQSGIENLINQTNQKNADASAAIDALNKFLPLVEQDVRNLTGDESDVTVALGGENGAIAQLKKQIDADNAAIDKDMAIIAGGATAAVVGGLMIAVGVLAEIETAGASTALVVGGLAVVAGGSVAMGIAGKNLADTKSALADSTKELKIDELSYASTKQANVTVGKLVTAVQQASTAVENLQKGWTSLESDFTQVIEQLDTADPDLGSWLVNVLEAANTDWADTLHLAQSLQQYGTIPTQTNSTALAA